MSRKDTSKVWLSFVQASNVDSSNSNNYLKYLRC